MTGGDAFAFASLMALIGWIIWLRWGWPSYDRRD